VRTGRPDHSASLGESCAATPSRPVTLSWELAVSPAVEIRLALWCLHSIGFPPPPSFISESSGNRELQYGGGSFLPIPIPILDPVSEREGERERERERERGREGEKE